MIVIVIGGLLADRVPSIMTLLERQTLCRSCHVFATSTFEQEAFIISDTRPVLPIDDVHRLLNTKLNIGSVLAHDQVLGVAIHHITIPLAQLFPHAYILPEGTLYQPDDAVSVRRTAHGIDAVLRSLSLVGDVNCFSLGPQAHDVAQSLAALRKKHNAVSSANQAKANVIIIDRRLDLIPTIAHTDCVGDRMYGLLPHCPGVPGDLQVGIT